jgi:hypothetical protein
VTTAKETAQYVEIERQSVHRRLERLQKETDLRRYKPGRVAVYWPDESDSDR